MLSRQEPVFWCLFFLSRPQYPFPMHLGNNIPGLWIINLNGNASAAALNKLQVQLSDQIVLFLMGHVGKIWGWRYFNQTCPLQLLKDGSRFLLQPELLKLPLDSFFQFGYHIWSWNCKYDT